jgi:cytidylate kinase
MTESSRAPRKLPTLILAGPIASGKTTLAESLADVLQTSVLDVRATLISMLNIAQPGRADLQNLGSHLERTTAGTWVARAASTISSPLIIDSIRTHAQLLGVRELLDPAAILIYLHAGVAIRSRRFKARSDTEQSALDASLDLVDAEQSEIDASERLGAEASIKVATDELSANEVQSLVLTAILRQGTR